MPYIKQEDRPKFEEGIKQLLHDLPLTNNGLKRGELNYVISSIVWRIFEQHPSYTLANDLHGVLECVANEFYRRKVAPYEDLKIKENGDIQ